MGVYKIAEINIKINPLLPETEKQIAPFLTDEAEYAFDASASREEINEYIAKSDTPCSARLAEGPIILTKICKTVLNNYDGFFFHSSCLMLGREAYLFTALSGTGKSTHTANWRRLFGDKVTMINDDKPIVRKIDGRFYVCSTPWMGKSNIGCNLNVPIKAIYVLKRGEQNAARHVRTGEVFRELLEATLLPDNKESMLTMLSLFDELFSSVQLIELTCNKDVASAQVAYDTANGKSNS